MTTFSLLLTGRARKGQRRFIKRQSSRHTSLSTTKMPTAAHIFLRNTLRQISPVTTLRNQGQDFTLFIWVHGTIRSRYITIKDYTFEQRILHCKNLMIGRGPTKAYPISYILTNSYENKTLSLLRNLIHHCPQNTRLNQLVTKFSYCIANRLKSTTIFMGH